MKRRRILIWAIALLLALFATPSASWSAEKVRLGYSGVGSGEEVHHFAKEVGLFNKSGLDVEIVYIPGGSTVVQAMASGEVQFGRGSATEVVSAHMAGFPLKILAALINKFVYSFVTPAIVAKPQDLKGRAVAISRFGSGSDFITRMALKSWGLEPGKDVTILQVGNSPERLAAIMGGKVHGSILSLSQTPRAKKLGLRVLADLSQIDTEYPQGVLLCGIVVDRKETRFDPELSFGLRRRDSPVQNQQASCVQHHSKKQRFEGQSRNRGVPQPVVEKLFTGLSDADIIGSKNGLGRSRLQES